MEETFVAEQRIHVNLNTAAENRVADNVAVGKASIRPRIR